MTNKQPIFEILITNNLSCVNLLLFKIILDMRESGLSVLANAMAEVFKSGLMDQNIKVFGRMIRLKGGADLFIVMVMCMRASGKMIKQMGEVHTSIFQVQHIEANGLMISNMVSVSSSGRMVQIMKGIIDLGRNMGGGSLYGLMVLDLKETFIKMGSKVKEFTNGRMEDSIQVNGKITRCMGRVHSAGLMGGYIKEAI